MRLFLRSSGIVIVLFLATIRPGLGQETDTNHGNLVTINPDNVLLVNGRKVFPIGFTLGPPPDALTPWGKNGLQELADAGGTFIRTGPTGHKWSEETFRNERTLEVAAREHGLFCWLYLRELDALKPKDLASESLLRRVVREFKDSPVLLTWKGADEPEWGKVKVSSLLHARDVVRQIDTNHPIAIIQAPRGTVATLLPYAPAGDITGVDIYPVSIPPGKNSPLPNKEISMVGDYARRMRTVSGGKIPVWMVLQIAWSGVVKPGTKLVFPTLAQERFMTYQAIINGARGLVYFGGNIPQAMTPRDAALGWNWTFWQNVLRPVIEEIGSKSPLTDALTAPDSKLPVVLVSGPGIEFCVREVGDDIYLLACKREGSAIQAKFKGLPVADGEWEVMFEASRKTTVKNGGFSDGFDPFAVHVYHFTRR